MQEGFLRALCERRAEIRVRWEALLRIEKVSSALANPDTLVFLFDRTLNEVFSALQHRPVTCGFALSSDATAESPLFAYYLSGEQALLEALVLVQAASRDLDSVERAADFAHLRNVMHQLAQRDIETLDRVFKQQKSASKSDRRAPRNFAERLSTSETAERNRAQTGR